MNASSSESAAVTIVFRHPTVPDGLALWRLVREAGTLDLNSTYAYLMVCRDFADTCIVADQAERITGFVMGYRPPRKTDTVFVWQIGVAPDARGHGLASVLLDRLLQAPACAAVRFLETNVTPSNRASRSLFESLARRLGAPIEELEGFASALFPDRLHEPERLLRIGPFERRTDG
ncbi:MAG: diaminobutyrate acetyltransferase [Deltaproteobacteria bacterium]|jgi:L-2,4-diaminobutyric acid acetyltransferase|nr:diaminobutyrate acetyltransferase [Deltaproteobacteria bacterium]